MLAGAPGINSIALIEFMGGGGDTQKSGVGRDVDRPAHRACV